MPHVRPLLMIPGPIELSPAVRAALLEPAAADPAPSHVSPRLIEDFGASIEAMRGVWRAAEDVQPFIVSGGGTTAMEMAAANLVEPGDRAMVVNSGYFSDRAAEMLRRAGAEVIDVRAPVGDAPSLDQAEAAFASAGGAVKVLFATHVDTSTGVRVDPEPLAALAARHGALSVFDGVCATAGERFEMAAWGADVYLTASQKAIGLPPGLALLVASRRAVEARRDRSADPPPLALDWLAWQPIMEAYEERRPSYFSTPATGLVAALRVGLEEILADGMEARWRAHRRAAEAMRAAWEALGLVPVPVRTELAGDTLSALRFPSGVGAALVGEIAERGVIVAGGLHPEIRGEYFRIGHMGWTATQPALLVRTVRAVAEALAACGHRSAVEAAVEAASERLG